MKIFASKNVYCVHFDDFLFDMTHKGIENMLLNIQNKVSDTLGWTSCCKLEKYMLKSRECLLKQNPALEKHTL